jgi:hypothetical protein
MYKKNGLNQNLKTLHYLLNPITKSAKGKMSTTTTTTTTTATIATRLLATDRARYTRSPKVSIRDRVLRQEYNDNKVLSKGLDIAVEFMVSTGAGVLSTVILSCLGLPSPQVEKRKEKKKKKKKSEQKGTTTKMFCANKEGRARKNTFRLHDLRRFLGVNVRMRLRVVLLILNKRHVTIQFITI